MRGVSKDSLLFLLLRLKNQNISATRAMKPKEPKTPPTTRAGLILEEMPAAAEDSTAPVALVREEGADVFDVRNLLLL